MADEQVPDIYSDLFNIYENSLGVLVVLTRSEVVLQPGQPVKQIGKTVGLLRFSPENWKVILMVGRKQLKDREVTQGVPYKIPSDILTPLKLTEADW